MLKEISDRSKAIILLEFTSGLVMHSNYGELSELKNIIKEEEKERISRKIGEALPQLTIKEMVKEKEKELQNAGKEKEPQNTLKLNTNMEIVKQFEEKPRIPVRIRPRVLRIPESRLPERLQYLKPTIQNIEIDLGRLNPFLQDPIVRRIECNGPGEMVIVRVPSPKYTDIILDKEEISEIVQVFERMSKIPATEGIYKVVVGKFIFSAIISEVIGSKFSINKMAYAPIF
jgi:hypothetical protein